MTDDEKIEEMIVRLARKHSKFIPWEFDDMVQEGRIAAWNAAKKYDGVRGTLTGWCSMRVSGAMLDYMRRIDPLSRQHRKACLNGLEVAPEIINLESMSFRERSKI